MMPTAEKFLSYKKTIELIDGLVENWFNDNGIPEEYRLSVPLILLCQETEISGQTVVSYFMGILSNHHPGNC